MGDLEIAKIALPLIYGLSVTHGRRDELRKMVQNNQLAARADRIRTILDEIHTRDFMSVIALTSYITVIFAHIKDVLQPE
jgi:hypothetical protein